MKFFHDLGSLIERRWQDQNYNEEIFPEIAAQALQEMTPDKPADSWDIIRWLYTNTQLPAQRDVDGKFGDPPITLYNAPRFYIDVYFWVDGTTDIHQHAFSGAFQVLAGSSIHSRYDFALDQKINAHFSTGRVVFKSVELLQEGDIRPIYPGDQFIHSLFHLDRPSATITVRTYHTPDAAPQYSYRKPYLAIDPFYREESAIKKVQSAALLLRSRHPEADALIGDLLALSDFHTAYSVLHTAFSHLTQDEMERVFHLSTGRERFHNLLEKARTRHGQLIDLIPPVFEEAQRQQNIVNRRVYLTDAEHRFFLALLLNVPQRAQIVDLVRQRYPQSNPIDLIADWVEELSTTRMLGSAEPNVLGVDNFDDDALLVLRGLLEGLSLQEIKATFAEEYSENSENMEGEIEKTRSAFQNSILLKSLLFAPPLLS
ncbi:MAG TPA: hypothetical protein VNO70_17495 [Blastocatellia bacterium]|nr:hypothetical protein [Blastocatellia bacterium]